MSDQAVGTGLERDRGQRSAEVGFVEGDRLQPGRHGIGTTSGEGEFIASGKHDQGVGMLVPLGEQNRVGQGEVQCGVRGLAGLGARGEIGAGYQVQTALEVRHGSTVLGPLSHVPLVC